MIYTKGNIKIISLAVSFVENNMVPTVSPENNDRQPLLNCSQVQPSMYTIYKLRSI